MRLLKLKSGEVAQIDVKYSHRDFDGKQIEEGSVVYIEGELLGDIKGIVPDHITESDISYLKYSQK